MEQHRHQRKRPLWAEKRGNLRQPEVEVVGDLSRVDAVDVDAQPWLKAPTLEYKDPGKKNKTSKDGIGDFVFGLERNPNNNCS